MPSGPPKKHATQSALDHLKPVQVDTLPEHDRRCNICMQDYYVKPTGPRSPYVETVRDEEDAVSTPMQVEGMLTAVKGDASTVNGEISEEGKEEGGEAEGESPLEMPCGHIFGATCLKAWLYQSPTCPLCRVEVESYTEEPQLPATLGGIPAAFAFEGDFQFTHEQSSSSDEMHVEPSTEDSADTNTPPSQPQPQPQPQFGHLAFQFIFTTPPPSAPAPATTPAPAHTPFATPAPTRTPTPIPPTLQVPTPTVSRPTSAHTIRHHPYARTPTPSTPSPLSLPSVTDRPDLFCAQRVSGLCSHDVRDENLLRLECGHAFHEDCLDGSMRVEGYPTEQEERRCPRCRRWMGVLQ